MSIAAAVTSKSKSKFVIPCAGKMFRSSIQDNDKALCFLVNKGYFETEDLTSMLDLVDDANRFDEVILVGEIEKVRLAKSKKIVYRQRIFTKSLNKLCSICKVLGVRIDLSPQFKVTINSIMNCRDDLPFLERYAKRFNETIDVWLTHCCVVELFYYFKSRGIATNMEWMVERFLRGREDYLYRAPFLVSSYDIKSHSSSVFLGFEAKDRRLYRDDVTGLELLKYGYTKNNVEADAKGVCCREDSQSV